MFGLFVGIVIGIFVGVAGAIIYRNNEKIAWQYAIKTLTGAKAKAEADAVYAKNRIDELATTFKTEREKLIQSFNALVEEALTKPEAELKAAIEALLAKGKSLL